METVEVTSFGPSTTTVADTDQQPADVPVGSDPAEHIGRAVFDGQAWTHRNRFDRVLRQIPQSVWQDPQQQGWQRIKHNARREVWRGRIAGAVYYLKYYRSNDWSARLKRLWRDAACEAEWKSGVYALEAVIAAVSPAGYTTGLRRDGRVYSLLVTEAVEPAYALSEFWQQVQTDDDPGRHARDVTQLIELLSELIARAHQAGFEHLDMHAANILVQPLAPGRYRTLFVDLHSARLGVPLGDRAVVRNLAQLNQWFRRHSSIGDRLRFLRAYLRWRNEYESVFEHGRPLAFSFRQLVQALVNAADRHAHRLWAQRDRRARRHGRYFARVRAPGGWRGLAVVQTKHRTEGSRASGMVLERAWWREQLERPLRWFAEDAGQTCKDSHSACVRRAVLTHEAGNLPVIIKRPLARNWRRRLGQLLAPSRSMRGWRLGHALLNRNLAAASPLAVLERRLGPLRFDSLLITEAIPGAVDLETHLRQECAARSPADWWRYKRQLGELVARHLRRLQDRRFIHRDCKASNILVLGRPRPRLFWIDMDGLRLAGWRFSQRRYRLRPLVSLAVSLQDVPGLTRTDGVRFLKRYCARWGVGPRAWRRVWRQLVPLVGKKRGAKQARAAWKQAHYGRK